MCTLYGNILLNYYPHNFTVHSFCELAPKLIETGNYLLSEVFCQDPLERYFSRQRHRGGGNDNPTVDQFHSNSDILVHIQQIKSDFKTMNVKPGYSAPITESSAAYQLLPKRARLHAKQ